MYKNKTWSFKFATGAIITTLMLTALFASLSTVSAAYSWSASLDENVVIEDTSMVRSITITNDGTDDITKARVTFPSGWNPATTIKVFKDNIVTLENGNDNIVLLPKGTLVELQSADVKVLEGTEVIVENGTDIHLRPETDNTDVTLKENLKAAITNDTKNFTSGVVTPVDNYGFTTSITENANTLEEDVQVTVDNGTARLLADTQVVRLADNVFMFPSDNKVALVSETTTTSPGEGLTTDNSVTLKKEYTESLDADNTVDGTTDNTGRVFVSRQSNVDTDTTYTVESGDNFLVYAVTPDIVFPSGTEVILTGNSSVTLFENTEVIREAGENARMTSATAAAAEKQPKNWAQSAGADYLVWDGIGDNKIAPGDNLEFPFKMMSPVDGGVYDIFVKIWADTTTYQKTITMEVDNTPPAVDQVDVAKEWASENEQVDLTVTFTEPVTRLDNLLVEENNAPENAAIENLSPNATKTEWTGTYTTGDNIQRDGVATVYVVGSKYEDGVGHEGTGVDTATFKIDRVAPPAPALTGISGWPKTPTNVGQWLLEDNAQDNYRGSLVQVQGLTVKIRQGTDVDTVTASSNGYWYYELALNETEQPVGVRVVDLAGNEGSENFENITYDATAPSIAFEEIADKTLENDVRINDNTPKITLSISDTVMGIENDYPFDSTDNSGYLVQLQQEDGTPIDNLINATPPAEVQPTTISFENTYPTELDGGTYRIKVVVGDNLQMADEVVTFVIDTDAPSAPTLVTAGYPTATQADPKVLTETDVTITGTREEDATIKVETSTNGVKWTEAPVTPTYPTDTSWSVTVTVTAGTATNIRIYQIDEAGNKSEKQLFGWLLADATEPGITDVTLAGKSVTTLNTDKTSIIVAGKVTKDDWEDYTDLSLRITYGTTSLTLDLGTNGEFSKSIPLSEGSNTISLVASDEAGNTSAATLLEVTRTVTPIMTYAAIIAVIAIILAAIAILSRGGSTGSSGGIPRSRSGL